MSKRTISALSWALLLCLSGCALVAQQASEPPEGSYKVYFAAAGKGAAAQTVDFEYRLFPEEADMVAALAEAVLSGPENGDAVLVSPLPAGVVLRSAKLGEDGQLHLNLSEQYGGLSGVDLTVANACFVLTLCQAPGVKSVYITVEGEVSPFQSLKTLSAADFLSLGGEEEPVSTSARLFFPRADGMGLGAEERSLTVRESDTLAASVVSTLLAGPVSDGLKPLASEGTVLRWTRVEDGICYVSLSETFFTSAVGDEAAARLALYALVNTLCAMENAQIERVSLLMEGTSATEYGGVSLGAPLAPDYSLAAG